MPTATALTGPDRDLLRDVAHTAELAVAEHTGRLTIVIADLATVDVSANSLTVELLVAPTAPTAAARHIVDDLGRRGATLTSQPTSTRGSGYTAVSLRVDRDSGPQWQHAAARHIVPGSPTS